MSDREDPPDVVRKKKCELCGEYLRSSGIKCNNQQCSCYLHTKCFNYVSKIIIFENQTWYCKICSEAKILDSHVLKKEYECLKRELEVTKKLVAELENVNQLQKEKINELLNKTVSKPLLSTIVSTRPQTSSGFIKPPNKNDKQTSPVLIIKPKDRNANNSNNILNDIKSKVNPVDLNLCITNTKTLRNGILVGCSSKEMLNKLKSSLTDKIGKNYLINEGSKLKPRLKIYRVEKCYANKEIFATNLISLNEELKEFKPENIKTIFIQTRGNYANVIIEVSPAIRNIIMKSEHVYMGWQRCGVSDHYSLIRCFKCSRFGHTRNDCKSTQSICGECSGSHEHQECNSDTKKCINCVEHNERHKSSVSFNHSVTDSNCHVYKILVQNQINKTDYNE